jgi:ABC-type branched-subunit amino acid transport system ATPase component
MFYIFCLEQVHSTILYSQFLNELTEEIVSFKPIPDLKVKDARILIIGPVGAGKSSFFNSINSIFQGRITQKACSGSAEQSLTTAVRIYYKFIL